MKSNDQRADHPTDQRSEADPIWYVPPETLAKHRANLLPAADRAELDAMFGKIIGPLIDAKLEAKARELVQRYQDAWSRAFVQINGDGMMPRDQLLCTREDAATMLCVSLSTIKRMEADGHLPEPIQVGERGVRHRLVDIEVLARFRGAPKVPGPGSE